MVSLFLIFSGSGCDGASSELPIEPTIPACLVDADGDGFGDPGVPAPCGQGIERGGDCDDGDPAVNPEGIEVCNGIDDDCDGAVDQDDDPYVCGLCPDVSELQEATFEWQILRPCDLDPRMSHCDDRIHQFVQRTDGYPLRDELLLFLPPGPGTLNYTLLQWGALAGYRVISLGWANDDFVAACAPDEVCLDNGRWELLYGEDRSDVIDLEPYDALAPRLYSLLTHLDTVRPEEGWGRYYDDEGVRWEEIVVFGWSFGAGQAAYLAGKNRVDGLILLSGPQELVWPPLRPPAWIFEPRETPVCAQWGLYHAEEAWLAGIDTIAPSLRGMGLVGTADVDTSSPPYDNAQILTTASSNFLRDDCSNHSAVAMDGCMDPALLETYLYLFCTAAQVDDCGP